MTEGETFTMKEVVIEIRDDVKLLSRKLDRIDRDGSIGTRQELGDHESRLRRLESSGFRLQGVWASVCIAGGVIAGLAALGVALLNYFG